MTNSPTTIRRPRATQFFVDASYRVPSRYLASWVGLIAMAIASAIFAPDAYRGLSLELITGLAGCLFVASLGQMLVVMVGTIDLSVPAFMALATAINIHFVGSLGAINSFLLSVAACAGISAVSGTLIFGLRLNALIVTLAVNAIVAAGLTLWLGQTFSSTGRAPEWLISLADSSLFNVSALFWIAILLGAVVAAFLNRTRSGRKVAAVGANKRAARFLGTRVNLVGILTFAGAGALYGFAGCMVAGLVRIPGSSIGDTYQLTTITAVAVAGAAFAGGSASISSLVAACLLLQLFAQALSLNNLSAGVVTLVQGTLLVLAVSLGTLSQYGVHGFQKIRKSLGSLRTPV